MISHTSPPPSVQAGRVPSLAPPAIALVLAQVLHIADSALRGSPPSPAPDISQPGHVGVLVLTLIACGGLLLGRRWGAFLLTAAAATVTTAALLYHAGPGSLPFTNSYWDGGDAGNWATIALAAATGGWCLLTVARTDALGWRADRRDDR